MEVGLIISVVIIWLAYRAWLEVDRQMLYRSDLPVFRTQNLDYCPTSDECRIIESIEDAIRNGDNVSADLIAKDFLQTAQDSKTSRRRAYALLYLSAALSL